MTWFLLIFSVFIIGYFIFLIIDYFVFLFDMSIPNDYAKAISEIAEKYNGPKEGIDDISNTPYGLSNSLLTFIMGLFGGLLSIFLKKSIRTKP